VKFKLLIKRYYTSLDKFPTSFHTIIHHTTRITVPRYLFTIMLIHTDITFQLITYPITIKTNIKDIILSICTTITQINTNTVTLCITNKLRTSTVFDLQSKHEMYQVNQFNQFISLLKWQKLTQSMVLTKLLLLVNLLLSIKIFLMNLREIMNQVNHLMIQMTVSRKN